MHLGTPTDVCVGCRWGFLCETFSFSGFGGSDAGGIAGEGARSARKYPDFGMREGKGNHSLWYSTS